LGGIGIIFFLFVIAVAIMMITGPLIGSTFSVINSSLSGFGGAPISFDEELGGTANVGLRNSESGGERLIIREGSLILVVKDTLAAQKAIEKVVAEMQGEGAFIVSSNVEGNTLEKLPYVYLTIRVPAQRFDEIMDRTAGMAVEVRQKKATAQDITAEYVDLKARLEALEAARQRLFQIMKESATTEALLLAEKELTAREAEIESIKGRMQYLSESAQLSSISVELIPDALSQPVVTGWRPSETVRQSVDMLVNGLKAFADFLIVFSIAILPWLLFFYGVYLLIKWLRAQISKKRGTKAETEVVK
jgi:hypothetical protein